jgi:uncharacterized protein YqgC (DUF456 family)
VALQNRSLVQPAVAQRFDASGWEVLGAPAGSVPGFLIAGPVGAELLFGRTLRQPLKSGAGTVVGLLLAFVVDADAALTVLARLIVLVLC